MVGAGGEAGRAKKDGVRLFPPADGRVHPDEIIAKVKFVCICRPSTLQTEPHPLLVTLIPMCDYFVCIIMLL